MVLFIVMKEMHHLRKDIHFIQHLNNIQKIFLIYLQIILHHIVHVELLLENMVLHQLIEVIGLVIHKMLVYFVQKYHHYVQ